MDATATNSLTLDEIGLILSSGKQRGIIKPVLDNFFDSGEVYLNLSQEFPGKDALSLRNSVKQNLDKHFPIKDGYNYRLVTPGEKGSKVCLLINMDVYQEMQQAEVQDDEVEVQD